MTPPAIIDAAQIDGVRLALSDTGAVTASGNKDAVARWLPRIRECRNAIVAALKVGADGTASEGWRLHFANADVLHVFCTPPVTHAEILARYADAIAAEPCTLVDAD